MGTSFLIGASRRVTGGADVAVRGISGAEVIASVEGVAPGEVGARSAAIRKGTDALLVVEIGRRFEDVARRGHVHRRAEVRVQRVDGRLQRQHQLRDVALHILALLGGRFHQP